MAIEQISEAGSVPSDMTRGGPGCQDFRGDSRRCLAATHTEGRRAPAQADAKSRKTFFTIKPGRVYTPRSTDVDPPNQPNTKRGGSRYEEILDVRSGHAVGGGAPARLDRRAGVRSADAVQV